MDAETRREEVKFIQASNKLLAYSVENQLKRLFCGTDIDYISADRMYSVPTMLYFGGSAHGRFPTHGK
jgi:hypothetical protein